MDPGFRRDREGGPGPRIFGQAVRYALDLGRSSSPSLWEGGGVRGCWESCRPPVKQRFALRRRSDRRGEDAMPVFEAISRFHDDLTAWRRDIHAHPELGFEERR